MIYQTAERDYREPNRRCQSGMACRQEECLRRYSVSEKGLNRVV